jgi:hypothetical protein
MEQHTIQKIYKNFTKPDKVTMWKDKSGRQQVQVVIVTDKTSPDKVSSFVYMGDPVLEWQQNQAVNIEVTGPNAKGYLNFKAAPFGPLPKQDIGVKMPREGDPINPPGNYGYGNPEPRQAAMRTPGRRADDVTLQELKDILLQIKDAIIPPEIKAEEVFRNTN